MEKSSYFMLITECLGLTIRIRVESSFTWHSTSRFQKFYALWNNNMFIPNILICQITWQQHWFVKNKFSKIWHTFRSGELRQSGWQFHTLSTPKAVPWSKHCFSIFVWSTDFPFQTTRFWTFILFKKIKTALTFFKN